MYSSQISIRVRYAETDRMGYVYYGNYATYFEVARVEALRQLGVSYKSLEDRGILLPVADYSIKYILPAHYDDELIINTHIIALPTARIQFEYQTYRGEQLLNTATTTLVFVDASSGRPVRCPEEILQELKKYF
ncbi:MAG: acyl-CoA thioesterase [Flavobacteriales bacterium]|jgi:acyl-CoA thioester hydrolase